MKKSGKSGKSRAVLRRPDKAAYEAADDATRWDGLGQDARTLFALAYDVACSAADGASVTVAPGFWFSLARQPHLSLELLQNLAATSGAMSGTISATPALRQCYQQLHATDGPTLRALQTILEQGPRFAVQDPRRLAEIMLCVAQTLRPPRSAAQQVICARKRKAAHLLLPTARARLLPVTETPAKSVSARLTLPKMPDLLPEVPVSIAPPANGRPLAKTELTAFTLAQLQQRPDEQGQCVTVAGLKLWHASHCGPVLAAKAENQDATWADSVGGNLVFALADGVSTSLGARLAAALAARAFVTRAAHSLNHTPHLAAAELLRAAAAYAQQQLEELLDQFRRAPHAPQFAALRGPVQPEVAVRLLANTLTRHKNWGPALATTLLGGVAVRQPQTASFQVHIAVSGDGAIEHFDAAQQSWRRELATDPALTALADALCPGPAGRAGLQALRLLPPVTLRPGDTLLLSSDGLARGHQETVSAILSQHNCWPDGSPQADFAWQVLARAAQTADRSESTTLFADNLSLLLLTATIAEGR